MWIFIVCAALLALLLALRLLSPKNPFPASQTTSEEAAFTVAQPRDEPFLIAPKIDGMIVDDDGVTTAGDDCADALRDFLERIEPGGPSGQVQLGYTLTIPIFDIFEDGDGDWVINEKRLRMYADIVRKVGRPVVVHVGANHFSPDYPITRDLVKDDRNLMTYADGETGSDAYFQTSVYLFTLSTDEDIPINRYRRMALVALSGLLTKLESEDPRLVRAVTLVGETYHLSKNIKNKMGEFFNIDCTDYSDTSRRNFRTWLQERFPSLEALNHHAGTCFNEWNQVVPPDQDFRTSPGLPHWRHFDSFAAGRLPVFGWAMCRRGNRQPAISIYLDGEKVGNAVYGLNRLDVYRNSRAVKNPNVGFRYMLDFRHLAPGTHRLKITVSCTPGEIEVCDYAIHLLGKEDVEAGEARKRFTPKRKVFSVRREGVTVFCGFPRVDELLFYNPYAALWQAFRNFQVENYLRWNWQQFTATGFPGEKVYCAQMVPELHGTWNQAQLATEESLSEASPYLPSLMLYGGLAHNPLIARYTRGKPYGVSQFNPLLFKDPAEARAAIRFHNENGAAFIAPYYMSLREDTGFDTTNPHTEMLIYPGGPKTENTYLYDAIKEAVRH